MMQLTHVAFGLLALSCLCGGPQLAAQTGPAPAAMTKAPAAPQLSTEVRVGPGALQGKLMTAAEHRPVGAHTMTLVDASGKPLQTVVTGADGVYHTSTLAPGSYSLMVRGDLQLDLVVADGAATRQLDILMPQEPQKPQISPRPQRLVPQDPAKVPAAPGGAAAATQLPAAAGLGTGTWALIGAGAAVAVAVPVVSSQRSSSDAVSPVQPLNGRIR